jgi:bifunctional non-homologous end joining protein LigD
MADLDRYREKREFAKTPEPPPAAASDEEGNLVFVIQQHRATRMHWDFRLEVDGVLKSWPLPKGPSLNPKDKRMAVMVEDHPYDYRTFEGVIPKGEYGAGQVIVWDEGVYCPDEPTPCWDDKTEANRRMRAAIEKGKISFTLRGRKLRGSYALVKTRYGDKDWLLIKHNDEYASTRDVLAEDRSVRSGLTIRDLQEGRLPPPVAAEANQSVRRSPLPNSRNLRPMLATLVDDAFDRDGWLWEPKLDGVRALAFLQDGRAELRSRRGNEITRQYPSVVRALEAQPCPPLLLDGEICALDPNGAPNFHLLQRRLNLTKASEIAAMEAELPVVYFVFDALYLDGVDLRALPLDERKSRLWARLDQGDHIRYVEHIEGAGRDVQASARALGFEGVVGKRADSRYEAGVRSRAWLKVKTTTEQEFVVGGYTPGEGARRSTFGALALGYYEDNELRYAGNVGSGFDEAELAQVKALIEKHGAEASPFAAGSQVEGEVRWLAPRLVARVKYNSWTDEGRLRAPVFIGLRDDIEPGQVGRERAAAAVSVLANEAPSPADPPADADVIADLLAQLAGPRANLTLDLGAHQVKLTNLDKEFWPAYKEAPPYTKRDLVAYYVKVSTAILPHLRDRPLTLTRYPNGIAGGLFYQKHYGQPIPPFVETVSIWSSHNEGDGTYILCNNLETLVWLAQIADLEIHAWMSRVSPEPDATDRPTTFGGSEANIDASVLSYPDYLVFDLDPYIYSGKERKGEEPEYNEHGWRKTVEIAFSVKELLGQLRLSSYVKTSGKTGLHIYVPLLRHYDYDEVREATKTLGRYLIQQHPRDLTMEWDTTKRRGMVFFDANQNSRGKNMAAQYSLRPTAWAGVSTPVLWSELADLDPAALTIATVPERLMARGDLWADILDRRNDLRALIEGGA